jgi:hypothetical protein
VHRDGDSEFLADFETKGLYFGRKAAGGDLEFVLVGQESGKLDASFGAGSDAANSAGAGGGHLNGGTCNGEMLFVVDDPSEDRIVALGECGQSNHNKQHKRH